MKEMLSKYQVETPQTRNEPFKEITRKISPIDHKEISPQKQEQLMKDAIMWPSAHKSVSFEPKNEIKQPDLKTLLD